MVAIDDLAQKDKVAISRALTLAEEVHERQWRKPAQSDPYEKRPFIAHPMRVALILLTEIGVKDKDSVCAALMHDVCEQSEGTITTHHLENAFGRNLALMVSTMTEPAPDAAISRKEQLRTYHERIARASAATRVVKLAERLDNLRQSLDCAEKDWQKEYLKETAEVYLPIAEKTNSMLHQEILDQCLLWEDALR